MNAAQQDDPNELVKMPACSMHRIGSAPLVAEDYCALCLKNRIEKMHHELREAREENARARAWWAANMGSK